MSIKRNKKTRNFVDAVRRIMDDIDHGIYHNGNDHRGGPLANCPRCVCDGLLAEIARLTKEG